MFYVDDAYLLLIRILLPYLKKRYLYRMSAKLTVGMCKVDRLAYGNGAIASVKKASRLVAHWYPSWLYTATSR